LSNLKHARRPPGARSTSILNSRPVPCPATESNVVPGAAGHLPHRGYGAPLIQTKSRVFSLRACGAVYPAKPVAASPSPWNFLRPAPRVSSVHHQGLKRRVLSLPFFPLQPSRVPQLDISAQSLGQTPSAKHATWKIVDGNERGMGKMSLTSHVISIPCVPDAILMNATATVGSATPPSALTPITPRAKSLTTCRH